MSDFPSRRGLDLSVLFSLLALVLGAWVASVGLGRESLWLDESYTWFFVRLPWASLLPSARIDAVNPPLYYALVKAFVGSSAPTEIGLRLPSVLFHVAGIAAAMAIGATIAGRPGRVTAAWVWALHPMAVWYAREARPYALAAALAAATMVCFLRAERGARPATWILG
jgi:mannosyltransferase